MDDLTLIVTDVPELGAVAAGLRDWSAAGLIRPFASVRPAEVSGRDPVARFVEGGELKESGLGDLLARRSPKRVRVLVLTSDRDGVASVRSGGRSVVGAVRAAGGRVTVTPAQLVVTRLGARTGRLDGVSGWHNLVLSPEDSSDPSRSRMLLEGEVGPEDLARAILPDIAALGALVTGVDQSPLDEMAVPPQAQFSVVRTFVRHLDGGDLKDALRAATLDLGGGYPLVSEGSGSATYIENVEHANATMVRAVWQRHRTVLESGRQQPTSPPPKGIGLWQAFRMLWSYLLAALRNAPLEWARAKLYAGTDWVASSATQAVFGKDSSFAVVVGGVRGDRAARLADQLRALRDLDSAVPDPAAGHEIHAGLASLWRDIINAGLTLLDGQTRASGMEAVQIGDQLGVIRYGRQLAPSRADACFCEIPGPLQAATGVTAVAPYDALAVGSLDAQLAALAGDPLSGASASTARTALQNWWRREQESYTAQLAQVLGAEYTDRLTEIEANTKILQTARATAGIPHEIQRTQSRLARLIRIIAIIFIVLVIGTVALFVASVIGLLIAVIGLLVWFLIWLGASLICFVRGQRLLFQRRHARAVAVSRAAAAEYNLAAAIRDARRCGDAYQLLLLWAEALARFAADPLGGSYVTQESGVGPGTDHPLAVQFGRAMVNEVEVARVASMVRRQVFPAGWLGPVWAAYLGHAGELLGPKGTVLLDDPFIMYAQRAVQEDVLLRQWVAAVEADGVSDSAAASLWERILHSLNATAKGPLDRLLERVCVEAGGHETLQHFLAGLTDDGASGEFPTGLFADRAVTSGLGCVAVAWRRSHHEGLGRTVILCEFSAAMPAESLEPHDLSGPGAMHDGDPDPDDDPIF